MSPTSHHHFVFVHGASHGAWCWYKIQTLLEASGHKVTCLDLKGAGINQTDPNMVSSMEEYNEPLSDFFSNWQHNEKVILVGHSIGGASVIDAMGRFPEKISMAVFIAAYMVKPGSTLREVKNVYLGVSVPEIWDFIFALGPDQGPTGMIMKKEFQREYFYNESPLEDSTLASMLLRPTPFRAMLDLDKLTGSAEVDSIPRVYMKTLKDHMMNSSGQDQMVTGWPPSQVYQLESDHSAFFSTPTALFEYLVEAAASIKSN